jgi:bifunctional DNase/RNase
MPRKLPPRANLENLKKQAKQLLKDHQAGSIEAVGRIAESLPRLAGVSEAEILGAEFALQDAQLVLAHEYGFASWPKLVEAVAAKNSSLPTADGEAAPATNPLPYEEDQLVAVRVAAVYPFGDSNQPETYMVFLQGEGEKVVPISIGRFEGQALFMALHDRSPARPLPYNLLDNFLQEFQGELHRVVVHTLESEIFKACLLVEKQDGMIFLDCRPSDGLVLAAQKEAPVFVTREVMEQAGRELDMSAVERVGEETRRTEIGKVYVKIVEGKEFGKAKVVVEDVSVVEGVRFAGIPCPEENCTGILVEKQSGQGKVFYGCDQYPDCTYASWAKPVQLPCPQCEAPLLFRQSDAEGESYLHCRTCEYRV